MAQNNYSGQKGRANIVCFGKCNKMLINNFHLTWGRACKTKHEEREREKEMSE